MTLIFSGNDFKYEMEGVMKLFIPATRFKHIFADTVDTEDDYAFISLKADEGAAQLYVCASVNGSKAERSQTVTDPENSDLELILSRLLFYVMSELTGKRPLWGVMTGVRPVKRVNKFLSNGYSRNELGELFAREFLCSREKFEIAYQTALTQKSIVDGLGRDTFSLYISIPFCPTRCSYCSFISQTVDSAKKLLPEYIDRLCEEIAYTGRLASQLGLKLDTVYFGGGTPTSIEAAQLSRIMQAVSGSFDMSNVREYTVEAGRADTITGEKLRVIKGNGAGRISVNPQTLNDSVLEAIGRKHTTAQFFDAFELAKRIGFEHINTDIIAGLPTDTPESFERTLDKLIEMSPDNITVHTLSIKRAADLNFSEDKQIVLKNPASVMIDYADRVLPNNGYSPYYLYRQKNMLENLENIGWSKPGAESLYNIFIMEEIQSIFAVGAGASTKLVDTSGGRLERIFNYKHPLEYLKHFDLMLDKKKEIVVFYAE
ncbi:MAG: coproporphyrinogen dehydrogenase HemZ [Ruminococcus sp.]|nr:coproporphyrinogen dehydrogenase HemZ [Ruminococcus sp.]